MSQEELASKSGVGRRSIQRFEAGEGNPTAAMIEALAQTLNTTPADLTDNGIAPDPLPDWASGITAKIAELEDSVLRMTGPREPEMQTIWSLWPTADPATRHACLYLLTGREEDLERVEDNIRDEVRLLRRHIPGARRNTSAG